MPSPKDRLILSERLASWRWARTASAYEHLMLRAGHGLVVLQTVWFLPNEASS